MNSVHLIGVVSQDPEVKPVRDGLSSVCNLTMETVETWVDKQGVKQSRSEFHQVTFWDKTADFIGETVRKGDWLALEGKLHTSEWTDKRQFKHSRTAVEVRFPYGRVHVLSTVTGQRTDAQEA